jgi:hypothetical protein
MTTYLLTWKYLINAIMSIAIPNVRVINQVASDNKTESAKLIPNRTRTIPITEDQPIQIELNSLERNNAFPGLSLA